MQRAECVTPPNTYHTHVSFTIFMSYKIFPCKILHAHGPVIVLLAKSFFTDYWLTLQKYFYREYFYHEYFCILPSSVVADCVAGAPNSSPLAATVQVQVVPGRNSSKVTLNLPTTISLMACWKCGWHSMTQYCISSCPISSGTPQLNIRVSEPTTVIIKFVGGPTKAVVIAVIVKEH